MQHRRPQHPSGRPISNRTVKTLGFTRRPFDEPLTPGLQHHRNVNAIGFTADLDIETTFAAARRIGRVKSSDRD